MPLARGFEPLAALAHYSWLLALLAAACQPAAVTPTSAPVEIEPKQLATVYISPTPNAAQMDATRIALGPSLTPPPVLPTVAPTAYIGIFLGAAESLDEGPAYNPDLLDDLPTPRNVGVSGAICATPPDPVFGVNWNAEMADARALGCPIQIAAQFRGTVQVFERGVMYWRGDTNEIWAVATGGDQAGRYWYVAQAPSMSTEGVKPPEGLRAPVGGFGGVWMGVPEVQTALGYARTAEQELSMQSQRFERGLLFRDSLAGQVFAFMVDGTMYGPY